MKRNFICVILLTMLCLRTMAHGQGSIMLVRENMAHEFRESIPAGNYSGIVNLTDDLYALISDKGERGLVIVRIDIDRETGDINNAEYLYVLPTGEPNRDYEDIVYNPRTKSFYIASEADNDVREFVIDTLSAQGTLTSTGRKIAFGDMKGMARGNRGFESLAYDTKKDVSWTTTECPLIIDGDMATPENGVEQRMRLMAVDSAGMLTHYAYKMDKAEGAIDVKTFVLGISALTVLDDGHLLVLEREIGIPESYFGAYSKMKIYAVRLSDVNKTDVSKPLNENSQFVDKQLVCEWNTSLGLLDFGLANYEGMCLGPRLDDGSQVIVLVSDSQNQYGGVLSDWLKTIVVR